MSAARLEIADASDSPAAGDAAAGRRPVSRRTRAASLVAAAALGAVQPYPDQDGTRWRISSDGGTAPRWSPDSRELFYRSGSALLVARLDPRTGFASVRPQVVFHAPETLPGFDVSADGHRFVLLRADEQPEARPHVIVNWSGQMTRAVPTR